MAKTSTHDEILAALEGGSTFGPMAEADREALAGVSRLTEVERGATIWVNGARADYFGVVVRGFIKMVRPTMGGAAVTAEIIGPGQVFGMLGVVDGKGCPLMAQAVTAARFIQVPKSAFMPLYLRSNAVRDQVVHRSTGRLRQAFNTMALLSAGRVDQRLAAVLFTLAESYGRPAGEGFRIDVQLTRQDLADLAGTTVESAIRVVSRWQQQGLVRTDQRRLTVLSEKDLAAILEG